MVYMYRHTFKGSMEQLPTSEAIYIDGLALALINLQS